MVLPAWGLLIFAPGWKRAATLIGPVISAGLLACLYAYLVIRYLPGAPGGFGSMAAVRQAFESDAILLAGWVHYLAFDLFVGSWEVRDAATHRIRHLWVAPCLVLTFLLGPVGLLLYLILRFVRVRQLAIAG